VRGGADPQEVIWFLEKEKTMSKLTQWLDHRMEVVGVEKWKGLSEYSGVPQEAIRDMNTCGSLLMLSRSERRLLAATLRVSLRRLEQLDDGHIDWIEDSHVYDAGVQGRPSPAQENDPGYWMPKETKPEDRGTPVIGNIRSSGKAEPDDDWQEEWGRCIPKRYGKGKDIYAMELARSGQSIVFRNIPPWEFQGGEAAVYCWNGWEAEGWFGRPYLKPTRARIITADGEQHVLDPVNIVRIGKAIGKWPLQSAWPGIHDH
jgi:hypothetical protein